MVQSILAPIVSLVGIVLCAAIPTKLSPDTRNISDIYHAAMEEGGTLQVAWGGDERSQSDDISKAFKAAFPNIKANFITDLSKYHDSRINNAFVSDGQYADVAVLQTLQDFHSWKDEGQLLRYKPATFDKLWTSFTDVDGAFLPVSGGGFGPFVFNRSAVASSDFPRSYRDMLDPKWKGKLVLTYPNDDDAVMYLFTQIIGQYGWAWFDALVKQDVQWVRGTATGGEVLAGMAGPTNRTLSFTTFPPSSDFAYVPPVSDTYMSWFQTSAILSSTKMPETAKLLQSFLVSDSWQLLGVLNGGFSSPRRDLGNGNSTIWNVQNTDFVSFISFMRDRTVVEKWRFQFEDTIGLPQGPSPLVDAIGQ